MSDKMRGWIVWGKRLLSDSSASAVTLAPGIIIANWTDATTISE